MSEQNDIHIRPMTDADVAGVSRLLRALAARFIVRDMAPEDADRFLNENDENGVRGFLARGYVYHVAEAGDELAGFIGLRDGVHVYHMFVDERWHRRGIARALWAKARRVALTPDHPGHFTVNASDYAVPVYAGWGFVPTAARQCVRGLHFTPMRLERVPA